jgi:hypothetical protein
LTALWTNRLPAFAALGLVAAGSLVVSVVTFWFSPRHTDVGYQPPQPIAYSHKLHAGLKGMDCRYCHRHVEDGPHATVPDADTCMGCHKQVKADSPALKLLRDSYGEGGPDGDAIRWVKVHQLPDYAYFNHAVHVNAGVGCASCHGRVDQMETVRLVEPLSMSWCLDCHRDPAPHLRPFDKITDMSFVPTREQGDVLLAERKLTPPTFCSACHR